MSTTVEVMGQEGAGTAAAAATASASQQPPQQQQMIIVRASKDAKDAQGVKLIGSQQPITFLK